MSGQRYMQLTLQAPEPVQELLVAQLDALGYDSYWQDGDKLLAYVPLHLYDEATAQQLAQQQGAVWLGAELMPERNWNAEWEASYASVAVDDFCLIYPSFRAPEPGYTHNICIQPQMSFGTGHHATTRNMIRLMRAIPWQGAQVLDVGSGTGVLAILAMRLGAAGSTLLDIEPWAVDNARENLLRNGITERAQVLLGGIEVLGAASQYQVVLANINRNVLLAQAADYVRLLQPGGHLLLSGFFDFDSPLILQKFNELNCSLVQQLAEDNWHALWLQRA